MSVVDSPNARRADLAAIHIAKAALGWDEDTYRDVMFTVCSVRSAGALDYAGRRRFLAHLAACGAAVRPRAAGQAKPEAWGPKHKRLWSLWQQLADAGRVADRSRSGLQSWVKNQTGPDGVDRIGWLTDAQLYMLIERAKQWLDRKG